MTPDLVLGPALLALLGWAGLSDLWTRRIPNACCGAIVALWPAHLLLNAPTGILTALVGAAGVFGVGFALWRRGILGGGDVKLLSALALWAGGALLLPFLLVVATFGGVLALAWLRLHRASLLLPVRFAVGLSRAGLPALAGDPQSLPYGVAVTLAGAWLTCRLFWS